MKTTKSFRSLALVGLATLSTMAAAHAALPLYANPGTVNGASYIFTAVGDGPVTAYFGGSTAGFGSVVGLSINGGPVTLWGLQNNTTALGTSFAMGSVSAGDVMRFIFAVDTGNSAGPANPASPSYFLSSDEADNPVPGAQHIYSTAYAGGDFGIPAGTYVGVEDISPLDDPDNDLDYDDHQFVFTGPGLSQVPEGGSAMALLGLALAGISALRRYME